MEKITLKYQNAICDRLLEYVQKGGIKINLRYEMNRKVFEENFNKYRVERIRCFLSMRGFNIGIFSYLEDSHSQWYDSFEHLRKRIIFAWFFKFLLAFAV